MEIAKLQLDMHALFDRIGERVMFHYEVYFDFLDLAKNKLTESNFIVVPIGFDGDDEGYLRSIRANIEDWASDAKQHLIDNNNEAAIEAFGEWLSDNADEERNAAFNELF